MGRSKRIVHECDGCGKISTGASDWELPAGYHGGEIQVVGEGFGCTQPAWWACSEACLRKVMDEIVTGKGFLE